MKYKVPEECKCEITINFVEEEKDHPIRGNKFISTFVSKGNPKTSNEFDGPIMHHYLSKEVGEIAKFLETTKENIEIRNKSLNDNVTELLKVMNSLKDL